MANVQHGSLPASQVAEQCRSLPQIS